MKNQPELTLRIPEDLLRKLLYVSEAEGRSPNNHILMLLRNNVQYFERAKGRIDQNKLRSIDLSEYEKNSDEA
ncbi:MAG: Arc family DNA-binding protein [Clostridia bacterium]|nr:Arc family DNA-binding protein [Clostridia bacterium]